MDPFRSKVCTPWLCVQMPPLLETTKCPEPLCPSQALPVQVELPFHQRVLPLLPRSYGLMRQTLILPPPQLPSRLVGLCRLSPVPAGCWPFPTLSLQVFPWMLGPIPRRLLRCLCPFLPRGLRPSPRFDGVGSPQFTRTATSARKVFSGLQAFLYVQASKFARHPGRSDRYHHRRMAAVAFTSEHRIVRYLSIRRIC
jgi:hypothetical protein